MAGQFLFRVQSTQLPQILFFALEQLVFAGAGGWVQFRMGGWARSQGRELRWRTSWPVWGTVYRLPVAGRRTPVCPPQLLLLLWRFRIKIHPQ